MKTIHKNKFPNENKSYRSARNKLLDAEINLRRQTEETAKLRRKLPNSGKLKENYVFEETGANGKVKKTKLSELFAEGKPSLIIYNFMYGPKDKVPCPLCNSIIDGINGMAHHFEARANIAVVSKSPLKKFKAWTNKRGWKNLRFLSSNNNTYNADYYGESPGGDQWPMLNVFRKTPKGIYHFYATEMFFAPPEKGQNPRHVDSIWPLWNLFDFLPEGRGDWYPKLSY